jgi:hypothetical protein
MRRRTSALALALLLAAAPAWPQQESSAPGVDQAQEILDRAIAALGGPEYLHVQDVTRRGQLYSFDRGQLASPGDRFVDYVKFPGKERFEIGKDGKIVYLNDNEQGWELDRQGIREMPPEQIEEFNRNNRRDLDYLLRFRVHREKMALYYMGREFLDNRRVHLVELVDEDNQSLTLVVDALTYLPVQLRYQQRDPLTGERANVTDQYAKYITVQGIKTPMHLARQRNGLRTFEAYLTEVRYNTPLLDNLFTRASLEERWQKVK